MKVESLSGMSMEASLFLQIRIGEMEALDSTLQFFEERFGRLQKIEYYQERRLKGLGLLDEDGRSVSQHPPLGDYGRPFLVAFQASQQCSQVVLVSCNIAKATKQYKCVRLVSLPQISGCSHL